MKHLVPVKTIEKPYSLHASITSWSRIDPPGWIIVLIPESLTVSILSLNGKKASESKIDPSILFFDFVIAMSTESVSYTHLTLPTKRIV